MPITFDNDYDVIVYALEKIISYARDNQYIFLAQSICWISSIIRLQQALVDFIDNLKTQSDITLRKKIYLRIRFQLANTPGRDARERYLRRLEIFKRIPHHRLKRIIFIQIKCPD